MEDSYIVIFVISAIVSIIVLIKFFQMANDLRSLNEKVRNITQIANDVHFIKQRSDGELNYLNEDRSKGELQFLIVNGYKDEAKRMLLRKIWNQKGDYSYTDLKNEYNHYFIKIGVSFPSEEDLGKISNPA